jgi:hypothetical protein
MSTRFTNNARLQYTPVKRETPIEGIGGVYRAWRSLDKDTRDGIVEALEFGHKDPDDAEQGWPDTDWEAVAKESYDNVSNNRPDPWMLGWDPVLEKYGMRMPDINWDTVDTVDTVDTTDTKKSMPLVSLYDGESIDPVTRELIPPATILTGNSRAKEEMEASGLDDAAYETEIGEAAAAKNAAAAAKEVVTGGRPAELAWRRALEEAQKRNNLGGPTVYDREKF